MSDIHTDTSRLFQSEHITIVDINGNRKPSDILLACDIMLNIFLDNNGEQKLIKSLPALCDNLLELCVGIFLSEGLIHSYSDIKAIVFEDDALNKTQNAYVTLHESHTHSCDSSKAQAVLPVSYNNERIFEIADMLKRDTPIHSMTGGTHSCFLFDNKNLYCSTEDISRHNAFDKAIGYALINGINLAGCMIFTSARISPEMVIKTVNAKIPVLISKSVPTKEAVCLAKQYNLTLLCKAGNDSFVEFAADTD